MTTAKRPYEETAHAAWDAKYPHGKNDRPRVTIWMPTGNPYARLQTRSHGCQEPDTLDDGPVIAYLSLGGVEFGGYLEDLEMLLAAAQDTLRWCREQESDIRERMAGKGSSLPGDPS